MLLAGILILFSSVVWFPFVQRALQLPLFLTAEPFVVLGLILSFAIIFAFAVPDKIVKHAGFGLNRFGQYFAPGMFVMISLLFGVLLIVNRKILQSFMNSGDEFSCYFFAECIKNGKLWAAPHPLSEFFEVVHVGNKAGKWFSVYPPGWPILWAIGLYLKLGDWVNPVLSVVAVFLLWRVGKKLFGAATSALGLSFLISSPFFLLNGASYFSHATSLLTVALFLDAFLEWDQKPDSVPWAVLCGFSVGYGLATRYLTMAAISTPFLLYKAWELLTKRKRWNNSFFSFSLILAILLGAHLYFNFLITGNFFEAPNHYYHSWERLGFHSNHTLVDALKDVVSRFLFLIDWVVPTVFFIYLIGLWQARRLKEGPLASFFRYGFFYLPIAYLFYYSWGGNQYGPRYYFEGMPFMALSAGAAIQSWWRKGSLYTRKILLGIALTSLAANFYLMVKHSSVFYTISNERKSLYVLAERSLKDPSLVFIRGFLGDKLVMAQEDAVRNRPDLRDNILYAHDMGEQNESLKNYYPDRKYYLGTYDRVAKEARLEQIN